MSEALGWALGWGFMVACTYLALNGIAWRLERFR